MKVVTVLRGALKVTIAVGRVARFAIGVLVIAVMVLIVVVNRLGRDRVERWRRARAAPAGTMTRPEISPCCRAGIIVVNRDQYVCVGCYRPVSGVLAPSVSDDGDQGEEATPVQGEAT